MGPASCRIGSVHFMAGRRKRPLNQASVSFASVCTYVSSFLVGVLVVFGCLFGIQEAHKKVFTFGWFAPVKRLAGKIISIMTYVESSIQGALPHNSPPALFCNYLIQTSTNRL